jgi:5-hydroxyisourate hydrolase
VSAVSPITTHVLDTTTGKPAANVPIVLERCTGGHAHLATYAQIGSGSTDADGRLKTLLQPGTLEAGVYRITFDTRAYYAGKDAFYPYVSFAFEVKDAASHYHVPLLLSPFGISTYRGS